MPKMESGTGITATGTTTRAETQTTTQPTTEDGQESWSKLAACACFRLIDPVFSITPCVFSSCLSLLQHGSNDNVRVCVRVRPMNEKEQAKSCENVVTVEQDRCACHSNARHVVCVCVCTSSDFPSFPSSFSCSSILLPTSEAP